MSDADRVLPRTAGAREVRQEALSWLEAGNAVALATVVARHGSAPSTPGQKLAVSLATPVARAVGTIGGGAIERAVISTMLASLESTEPAPPKIETFRLGANLGMCCGGSAEILVEVLRPAIGVVVVGAGHVGLATSRLLAELGFRVVLVDAREGVF